MAVVTMKAKDDARYSPAEWQARVDLAAAHRLCVMNGFHEGIFNHLTLTVPGKPGRYYQIPFGTHWAEVNASCFMEVSFDGELLAGEGEIEQSCLCIHAPIHRDVDRAAAVFHTHMPWASALSRLEDPSILPIGQTEIGIMRDTAYDFTYDGPAFDPAEGARLAKVIGDKNILIMASHGAATIGTSVAEAFDRLYYLERVAQVQLLAMQSNRPLKFLPQEIVDKTIAEFSQPHQYGNRSNRDRHFDALKRLLDKREPDYAD